MRRQENNVINLSEYRRRRLGKDSGTKRAPLDDDIEARILRIKQSLFRINTLMSELKKDKYESGPEKF